MTRIDLDRAIAYIDGSSQGHFAGPQPEERIARAECALGIVFPPTYREFLRKLGGGSIHGEEFYGIIDDDFENSGVPDAIGLTVKRRKTISLPTSFVVVGATGDGGDHVIDTSRRDENGESPVLEWWSMAPDARNVVAEDFGQLLWNFIHSATRE